MLFYYCNIYSSPYFTFSNVTEVTVEDVKLRKSNQPFIIYTSPNEINLSMRVKNTLSAYQEAGKKIEDILGNDYFQMTLVTRPGKVKTTWVNGFKRFLEALFASAFISNPDDFMPDKPYTYLINFGTSNIYLYFSEGSGSSIVLCRRDGNTFFKLDAYNASDRVGFPINIATNNAICGFLACQNFSTVDDIFVLNKIGCIDAVIGSPTESENKIRFRVLPEKIISILSQLLDGAKPIKPPPFEPLPPSGENTPGGQFDDNSDIIGDSPLPTLSASDTGFTRIYIPTLSQVKDLARYLWTDDTVIETIWNKIKQFFENPMEAIIGFNLVPVQVPSSGTKSFALMYIDTGVDMDTAANQFIDVDCGTLPIQLYYGSALDYSPYTKVSCYLPYIGMVQLNTDEVVGRTLQVKYRIDIVSGSCVAKIFVDGNCIYQYSGHCAITIPISASDFSSYVSAAISVAKLAVGAATGGAGGAAAAALNADVNQQTGSMFSVQGGSDNSGQIQLFAQGGASGPGTQAEPEIKNTQASFSGITPQNVANTVGEIMTAKPHVQHSGSFSGNSGYLGVRRPFVIIERPNLCLPENYQGLNGFPAMITMVLGECSGYTKVQQMVLSGCTATNPEQAEIMSLLKGGVIL